MRFVIMLGLAALVAYSHARAANAKVASTKIFTCSIGAKRVSVTSTGGRLTYHYGTAGKDEMSIVGIPGSGNIFQMTQRFAGMEYQLRFKNGEFSYIVYSSEGNERVGASATSGLVVMQRTKTILDKSCSPFAELAISAVTHDVPEDTDIYSAM